MVALARVLLSDAPLYRPGRRLFLVGVVENLAVITLYVVTRTVGIPFFGPHAGEIEEVEMVDSVALVAELALLAGLLSHPRDRP